MTPCFGKGMRLVARRLRLGSGFGLGLLLRQDPLELLGLLQLGAELVDGHLLDDGLVHAQRDQTAALDQAAAALGGASLAGTDLVLVT